MIQPKIIFLWQDNKIKDSTHCSHQREDTLPRRQLYPTTNWQLFLLMKDVVLMGHTPKCAKHTEK